MAMLSLVAAEVGEMAMNELISPLQPRFMFGSPPRLVGRQAVSVCQAGESSCLAINATGCCPNDNYCYVNPEGQPKCCANGSRCDDPCPLSAYNCPVSATMSGSATSTTSVRSACLSSNSCSSTVNSATVNTVSASPTGCTTGQISCPASQGGGCCNVGQTCTSLSTNLYCVSANGGASSSRPTAGGTNAAGLPTATNTSPSSATSSSSDSGGLSTGAKAGIGAGAGVGALLILSALIAWYIIARKRQQRALKMAAASQSADAATSHVSSPGGGSNRGGGDYFGQQAQPGPFTENGAADASGMGPYTPGGRGAAVPLNPQSPGDIAAPVEIASSGPVSPSSPRDYGGQHHHLQHHPGSPTTVVSPVDPHHEAVELP
ncbi:MAG: hypothetical protein M1838_001906 [Thelocarpon superellum]|nr:MAG: hypothetical protein M1838_001906 [Thelocarpon superellum]